MFFDLLLYCAANADNLSLERSVSRLSDFYGIDISKQALDDRFHERAVEFVKEILKQAIEMELGYIVCDKFFPQFNYVRIKDSTKFNVDNRLEEYFKGSGGNGTRKACVCIQYEYDIKSGKILDLSLTPGIVNDATNAKETKCDINEKDLVIRDLGYYNLGVLNSFDENGACFISRLNTSTSIFDTETGEQISFKALYDGMMKNKTGSMEMEVLVSKGKKTRYRLIVSIIPEEEYQKRLRKANKKNKENGYKTSDNYKERARFNLFITNIGGDVLSKDEILLLYRLRWQIELTFKIWKSVCDIDKIQPMKYERFVCLLMSKLVWIVVRLKLFWNLFNYHYKGQKKLLSAYKCFKTFQDNYQALSAIIKSTRKESEKNIKKFVKMFSKNHWKEKRKKRTNYEDIIDLFNCKTDNYNYICQSKKRAA